MKKFIVVFHLFFFFLFYSLVAFMIIFFAAMGTELSFIFIPSAILTSNEEFGNPLGNIVEMASKLLGIMIILFILLIILEIKIGHSSGEKQSLKEFSDKTVNNEIQDEDKNNKKSKISSKKKFHIIAIPSLIALFLFTITYNSGADNPALFNGFNNIPESEYPIAKDDGSHRTYQFPYVGDEYSGGPYWNYFRESSIGKGTFVKSSLSVMSNIDTEVTLYIINKENPFRKNEEVAVKKVTLKSGKWDKIDIEGVSKNEINTLELRLYSHYKRAQELKFKEVKIALKDENEVIYLPTTEKENFCFRHKINGEINTAIYQKGIAWQPSNCYEDILSFKNEE